MKQKGRNIFLGLLLGVFCLNVFLPLLLFVSIHLVRMEQREIIEKNLTDGTAFKEILFSESEYSQRHLADADEVELNGVMYDVCSVTEKDGRYFVKVLSDEQETGLRKVQTANEQAHSKAALGFLSALFFEKGAAISFANVNIPFFHAQLRQAHELINVETIPGPPPDAKA